MKKLLLVVLAAPVLAAASPLDHPVALAVRSAAESDPDLKPLWEAVALADLRISEARTARDAAAKEADAKIGGFIRSDAGLIIAGLRTELSANGKQIKQAEADLSSTLNIFRRESETAARRRFEIFAQTLVGAMTEAQAAEETAKLDARAEDLKNNCLASKASVDGFRSAAEGIQASIAAQERRIAEARAEIRADLPRLEEKLAAAQKAKTEAMTAFREAAQEKLLAAHPENADAIRAYFGK